ncbi:uroporphyrinogen-III synthase [Rhizobium grahamii]|uniref:Uroporphyrinogen-III synthase n=1 Tax=Rhizobium grahamii TaxID=1120045 RepID=A0A5Q0CC39_9HYPH|nr:MULTISPECIES: uroporphyrinogen-III synthase [Rhizobium]QFY61630.1 uroporphyrinogen-III synthase [Rhizobium grahamii]QRM49211.1 uroporphyrinogen-III synthase [Rhizobium sp. BG6]
MRVLVTRPLHSGERTAERLRDMGHEPILFPLAEPVHDPAALLGLAERTGPLAVTSAEAIRALASLPTFPAEYFDRQVFAVGQATAEEARAFGFRTVAASTGNGADLADMIFSACRQPVTYLAGSPRAATFEARANEIGLPIDIVECYRMRPLQIAHSELEDLLHDRPPRAILFYSRETTRAFFALMENPEIVSAVRFLCLSQAVAEGIPASLRHSADIALTPEEGALLSLLGGS